MEQKIPGYYSLAELEDRFGKSKHTIRFWIRKGWLKGKKGLNPVCKHEYYISEEDWLMIPSFMRKRRQYGKVR
jgi:hypothetical protein